MEQPTSDVLASTSTPAFSVQENRLIYRAIEVLERKLFQREAYIPSPEALFDYLRLKLAREPNEIFGAVFLDNKHRVIAFEALALGTINQAIVHPRVVVRRAMELNAAAVILAHNHPRARPRTAQRTGCSRNDCGARSTLWTSACSTT